MLGINLDDLQLGNDTLSDKEMEIFDDTLALEDELVTDNGPELKEESSFIDGGNYDIIQTSIKENDLKYVTYIDPVISQTELWSNIPNNKIKTVGKGMINKETGMFMCDRCDYKTDVIRRGYAHLHTVHGTKGYQCEKCDHRSKEKSHIKAHMETQHSGLRYDCDECEFQTAHKKDVKRHKLTKHNGGIKPFSCNLCTYRGATPSWVNEHKISRHNVERVNCDRCSYKSITMRGLNIHMKNQHPKHTLESPVIN